MAKKKRNSPSWLKRELDKRLYYPAILFTLLLCILVALVYSIPSIGVPLESQIEVYFQNLIYNFSNNSVALSPTPTPNPPNYYQLSLPSATPTPLPTIYPQTVDELQVSRSISPIGGTPNPLTPLKTITDASSVQKIYDAILALPPLPPNTHGGCVADPQLIRYDLKFMNKGRLVQHGVLFLADCGGSATVSLDGSYQREFYDQKSFPTLVEKILGLTNLNPDSTPPISLQHITYTSRVLGISFDYIPFFPSDPHSISRYYFTKEIGDTVYLYWIPGSNKPFSGSDSVFFQTVAPGSKYVEVFTKDPHQSLADAITKKFLAGRSSTCFVRLGTYDFPHLNGSFQTAAIIPFSIPIEEAMAKCTNYVTADFGVRYFMMDQNHPDKLLFVNIGQGNLSSGLSGGIQWDGTITIN